MLALVAATPAAEAQSIRPGLWEIQRSSTSPGGDADKRMAAEQERLAKLTPEQRKRVEERMASMPQMRSTGPGSMTAKVCVTPAMATHNETAEELLPDCETRTQSRTASGVKLAFTCTSPRRTGETEISYAGPKAYSMRTTIHNEAAGKPATETRTASGKWLSDDCGGVAPLPGQR